MKKQKNEMIRNLLYSICLHLLFFLFIIFNDKINNLVNKEIVNINILNIDKSFLDKNNIKPTNVNLYPNLTLDEKIELYDLSKKYYNKNKKFIDISNEIAFKNIRNDNSLIDESINGKSLKTIKKDILYLGPTDYKKLSERKEAEEKKKMENEENLKKTKLLNSLISQIDKEELPVPDINTSNVKVDTNTDAEVKVNKSISFDKNVEVNSHINIDKKIKEILVKEEKKNEKKVENVEDINIDINKIFTKEDVKKIKNYIKNDFNNYSLSLRERMNIQNQIIVCYKNAILQTGKNNKVKVSVMLKLFEDGIIDTKEIKMKIIDDNNKFNKEDYDESIENIKITLTYCNPIRNLPLQKYQSWKNINFIFDTTTIN